MSGIRGSTFQNPNYKKPKLLEPKFRIILNAQSDHSTGGRKAANKRGVAGSGEWADARDQGRRKVACEWAGWLPGPS
jgi:hypothetical protein